MFRKPKSRVYEEPPGAQRTPRRRVPVLRLAGSSGSSFFILFHWFSIIYCILPIMLHLLSIICCLYYLLSIVYLLRIIYCLGFVYCLALPRSLQERNELPADVCPCCVWVEIDHLWSIVTDLWFHIHCLLSIFYYLLSLLSIIDCPSIIHYLLSTV